MGPFLCAIGYQVGLVEQAFVIIPPKKVRQDNAVAVVVVMQLLLLQHWHIAPLIGTDLHVQ